MALYLATYDLNKNKDYPKLWAEFARLACHKAAESVYLCNVDSTTAVNFRDHLQKFVDQDDTLIVVPFSKRPATYKAKSGTKEWLDANCPS